MLNFVQESIELLVNGVQVGRNELVNLLDILFSLDVLEQSDCLFEGLVSRVEQIFLSLEKIDFELRPVFFQKRSAF